MMRLVVVILAFVRSIAPFGLDVHHHQTRQSPEPVDEWFENLPHAKPKFTKLHLYIHDILHGENPTIVQVAQANVTSTSPTHFGLINVVDDPLTLGLGLDTGKVGHVEGLYVSASMEIPSVLVAVNFFFTEGEYNGSTLSVLGRIPLLDKEREFPVVGGSGFFRLAQGVVTAIAHPTDAQGNHVVECQFKLVHY